ncbi:hypothetical protein PsYK624_059400 [Phanerochaete sordida]|uniref:Uncharacterized protein n=1 Tax=Phanerochaete sordida TaxID=48140 RepID=A0A9P3LBU1_9APHY|nr:hypothetical protein PsYK624_059400 [Phanerochaete sordida]
MLFSACILCVLYFAKATPWDAADSVQRAPPVSKLLGNLKNKISSAKFGANHLANDRQFPLDLAEPGILVLETSTSTRTSHWPPLITAVPEAPPSPDVMRIDVTSAAIDAQFCQGEARCRILLPLWIGEQESRGRMHLTQLVHLAHALNRTLVLPNVGKSRLGLCGKWSFEAYYDVHSIAAQTRMVAPAAARRVMLMDDFKTWLDMRPDPPHGRMLFFQEKATSEAQGALVDSADKLSLFLDDDVLHLSDTRLKNAYCLKSKFRGLQLDEDYALSLFMEPPPPLLIGPPDIPSGDLFINMLRRHEAAQVSAESGSTEAFDTRSEQDPSSVDQQVPLSEPDVLVVHWDLRHLPFTSPTPLPPLEYSSTLWTHARRLTAAHAPYAAVHWRMETVDPGVLPACAYALVDTLGTLLADPTLGAGVRAVWLATDVPWTAGGAAPALVRSPEQRSNTFRAFAPEHFAALDIVKGAFARGGALDEWALTGLGEEVQRYRAANAAEDLELAYEDDTGMLWEDSGVWGILDKMAAMEAALFVSGARGCGRVRYVWYSLPCAANDDLARQLFYKADRRL